MKKHLLDRFDKYIKKLANGCWEWQGNLHKDGYGFFTINSKPVLAHRISFQLYIKKIPKGLFVCHSCDNRKCVNPKHLWLGTQFQNMQDMMQKKRNGGVSLNPKRGENHPNCKFSIKQIQSIRDKFKAGFKTVELAREFKTNYKYIWKIVNNKVWNKLSMIY